MKLTFSTEVFSTDSESRTITGQIVPFGKPGNASIGATVFATGSIRPFEASEIILNMEHDHTRPVGRMIDAKINPAGIIGVFKIAETSQGDDLLVEAAEGLRTGLSIEAEIMNHDVKGNTIHILDAAITGVGAVSRPAFGENAQITKVAASEPDEADPTNPDANAPETTEEEEVVMTENTAPAVEATESAPVVTAAAVYGGQTLRSPINSPASYLEHSVRAALGDDDSKMYVKAASDTTTTEVAGLVPTPQLSTIWDPKSTSVRPAIAAIRTATLPAIGLTFEFPRVKTLPTVAVAAEKGAFSDTQSEIEMVSVSVSKFAGMQKFSVEVLDRTSPAFFEELVRLMSAQYAQATDAAVVSALAAGTLDATLTTLPWDGDEISSFISRAAASIYSKTKRFPTGIVMSPDQWGALIAVNDTAKRPLFAAAMPQNAGGALDPAAPIGNIMGLPIYVDPNMSGLGDDSLIVVQREAFVWYEGAGPLQLRTNIVGTGQIEVGYYGYGAVATGTAAGAFGFNAA